MEPSIPLRENRDPLHSQRHTIKLALAGGVKEFPAESRLRKWLGRIDGIASLPVYVGEYALYVRRRQGYGIGLGIVGVAIFFVFVPNLPLVVWAVIGWSLLIVSAIVVLGVAVGILVAVVSMHTGYSPANDELLRRTSAHSDIRAEVVLLEERSNVEGEPAGAWADVLNNLRSAEFVLSQLEGSPLFRTFTAKQKDQYYQALGEAQRLIREISNETSQLRIAS